MKLNLGAGEDRHEGYVSVDLRADVADVVADVRSLPYDDGSVEEILAWDILEHLPPSHTYVALAEWRRVLVPGGLLSVRVPNCFQLARALVSRVQTQAWPAVNLILTNFYGGHKFGPDGGEYDHHCRGFVPETLHQELERAGFEVIDNDLALNMTCVAKRV